MPLDINCFREGAKGEYTPEQVRESQRKRYAKESVVDEIQQMDKEWRESIFQGDNLRKDERAISKEIGNLKKEKKDASAKMEEVMAVKAKLAVTEARTAELSDKMQATIRGVGNIVDPSVPFSNDEGDNIVVETWGPCKRQEKMYHHHELLHMIDGVAYAQGVAVAGHRGYFLKGHGVMLNQALINYGLSFLMSKDYTPLQPPYFMNKDVMAKTAQLSEYDEALYKVKGETDDGDKYLIATSEQPISAYHMGEWLTDKDLPKKYAGYSTCFRKEAGSHGRDAWGIFRIHQFEKIEQFVITTAEESVKTQDDMIGQAKAFYQGLGLSYRVINIVSGELNNAAAKKLDLEAWFPTLGCFRELVSCSNCTDYQSRAMEIRHDDKKAEKGEKKYVHMLNATLTATERTICCILENYQTAEGVMVPEVLQPFMGGIKFMPFVKECPVNTTANKQAAAAEKKDAEPKKAEKKEQPKKEEPKKEQKKEQPKKEQPKAAALPAATGGDASPELLAEIEAVSLKVRDLKAAKAPIDEVKAAVAKLLELKAQAGIAPVSNNKKKGKK